MNFKNVEELQNKLNNEYKTLLDVIDNKIIITDSDLKLLFINKKGREFIKKDFLMKPCSIINTANCNTENCSIKRFLAGHKPLENICDDGTIERVSVSQFYDDLGKLLGYIIVATDISELAKLKHELLISEEIYKLALTQSKTTLWQYDVTKKSLKQLFSPRETTNGILDINRIYEDIPNSLVEDNIISKEDGELVRKLCQQIENGQPETEIELKMRNPEGVERWIRLRCNTIFDSNHQAVKSIGIGEDITDIINLKTKYQIEREYREAFGKDALCYLEVNLTKNKIITKKFIEKIYDNFYKGNNYQKAIEKLSECAIINEKGKLLRELKKENLITDYFEGKGRRDFEYQIYNQITKKYYFIKIIIFLININDDIYACCYINDINESKVKSLDLQKKAELDPLTGLYNRQAIENKINSIIEEFPENSHAMMILDIDNFKSINDNLGHLYGDALLCEIAKKITSKFRNDDLIARLGGDEYLILMKNISNSELALAKAKELCNIIEGTYGTSQVKIKVSTSVGIALYPSCGEDFDTLYHHSDQALYMVKNTGKNNVCLYDDKIDIDNKRTNIIKDELPKRALRKFSDNVGEYIFRILYSCKDVSETVTAVLELLGMHYNMNKNALFIKDFNTNEFVLQNFWHDQHKESSTIKLPSKQKIAAFISKYNDEGALWIEDINSDQTDPIVKEFYKDTNVKMVISYLIKNSKSVIGIISMEYDKPVHYTNDEKQVIATAVAIISTFICKQYQEDERNRYLKAIQLVLDFQNNGIYIIDTSDFTLIYYNDRVKFVFGNIKSDEHCYRAFRGYSKPCPDCPLKDMKETDQTYTKLVYNNKIDAQLEVTVKRVKWFDGREAAAITSIDITNYYRQINK